MLYVSLGETHDIPMGDAFWKKVDGLFIQGSQGGFHPNIHDPEQPNLPREAILDNIAKNGGISIEGRDQHPRAALGIREDASIKRSYYLLSLWSRLKF